MKKILKKRFKKPDISNGLFFNSKGYTTGLPNKSSAGALPCAEEGSVLAAIPTVYNKLSHQSFGNFCSYI